MNRTAYHAMRRAAFLASRAELSELDYLVHSGDHDMHPHMVELRRVAEHARAARTFTCEREAEYAKRAAERRSQVITHIACRRGSLTAERKAIYNDALQETLRIWRAFPIAIRAPLPADRVPQIEYRRAA